jgi:hypothetical protein
MNNSSNIKRQFSKGIDEGSNTNTLQKLSPPPLTFLKCPKNLEGLNWKDFRLYIRYLDLKAQNPDIGLFKIYYNHRYYQRVIKKLIIKGWAWRSNGKVYLKAYQAIWRSMGISRVRINGVLRYQYWKISIDQLCLNRSNQKINGKVIPGYLKEIEEIIRKKLTKRKLAQLRFALNSEGKFKQDQATFSAKSASSLFGHRSPSTGSKLRQKYFEMIEQTPDEMKPRFNIKKGRFEEPTKKVAI